MIFPKNRMAPWALLAIVVMLPLAGCKSESSMSKQDEANFKGGPMPAGYKPPVPNGAPMGAGAAPAPPAAPPGPAGAAPK
jgi:hypothetical protein